MANLRELLSVDAPDIRAIESHLDQLDNVERIAQTRSLGRKHQRKLFEIADGHRAIGIGDIVPASTPPMQEVVHHGKNTLGVFTTFAKVFVRPDTAGPAVLWGYNRNSSFLETVVGPGYFVAYDHSVPGEVLVDYLQLPSNKPDHWPKIIPNSARLSFFVYNGTQDVLRGVSKHVSIGKATKNGKDLPAWFILCRQA